ncbi:MAG: acyl-CoA reductase [Psychroserpens sp.]|nr:acyl-CoA reductase [Psychroserpens sp.]
MDLQQRINAFSKLGDFLSQYNKVDFERNEEVLFNELFFDGFIHQMKLAEEHNGWFNKKNMVFAINGWSDKLTTENLSKWLEPYDLNSENLKTIAIIMAGNIPLVGFHDFLSVLISGQKVLVKQSSNDQYLLPLISKYLEMVEPQFKGRIEFTTEKLEGFDAVIATGSDNTARYFDYYFKDQPSIIRKNRNSIAVLTGKETEEQLQLLSEDIFRYYGLGCRNVSKLFVPEDYDFDQFFKAMYHWHPIIHETKYANNYDYNKAVYLMSEFDMLENGFLMLKEDPNFASPIATVFYEKYSSADTLRIYLDANKEKLQCIVSEGFIQNEIKFGQTQLPELWDYADGVDTISFSLTIC